MVVILFSQSIIIGCESRFRNPPQKCVSCIKGDVTITSMEFNLSFSISTCVLCQSMYVVCLSVLGLSLYVGSLCVYFTAFGWDGALLCALWFLGKKKTEWSQAQKDVHKKFLQNVRTNCQKIIQILSPQFFFGGGWCEGPDGSLSPRKSSKVWPWWFFLQSQPPDPGIHNIIS